MGKPLIFDFSIPKKNENEEPVYLYDSEKNLNVITLNGLTVPFVNSNTNCAELLTKTAASRELDDDGIMLHEFGTMTKVDRESDDMNEKMMMEFIRIETNAKGKEDRIIM